MFQSHNLVQSSSVIREEKSEETSTPLYPVQASDSCLRSESSFTGSTPDREEGRNQKRLRKKKRVRDNWTDVRITNHIHHM